MAGSTSPRTVIELHQISLRAHALSYSLPSYAKSVYIAALEQKEKCDDESHTTHCGEEPVQTQAVCCHPEDDEPIILMHHLIAFTTVAFVTAMISGAMSRVGMEYHQQLGVSVFFQTLTILVVGPSMGYAALTFGYLSDHVDSKRWGRRKPFLLPTMLLASAGLIMYFTPPAMITGVSIPAWYFMSTLLFKVRVAVAFG